MLRSLVVEAHYKSPPLTRLRRAWPHLHPSFARGIRPRLRRRLLQTPRPSTNTREMWCTSATVIQAEARIGILGGSVGPNGSDSTDLRGWTLIVRWLFVGPPLRAASTLLVLMHPTLRRVSSYSCSLRAASTSRRVSSYASSPARGQASTREGKAARHGNQGTRRERKRERERERERETGLLIKFPKPGRSTGDRPGRSCIARFGCNERRGLFRALHGRHTQLYLHKP